MIEYVTVNDVNNELDPGWEGDGDAGLAVLKANAYLNTLRFVSWETQPPEVTTAGAYLAKEAASGNLFVDTEGNIKREKVVAEVEVETEFFEGSQPQSGQLQFIHALLSPWLVKSSATQLLRRL